MELKLIRKVFTSRSTIGELTLDGKFECFTLEDFARAQGAAKIAGKTAIPPGRYEVILNQSARFKKLMPLLLDVPNFAGIRIHPGNTDADTEGCILVGAVKRTDFVGSSSATYQLLFSKMQGTLANGKRIFIEIIEER